MLLSEHTARSVSHSTHSAHTPQHALRISRCAAAAHCPLLLLFTPRTTTHSTATAAGCCVLLPYTARTAHSPTVSVLTTPSTLAPNSLPSLCLPHSTSLPHTHTLWPIPPPKQQLTAKVQILQSIVIAERQGQMLGSFVSDVVVWAHSTKRQPLNTLCTHSTARSAHLSLCCCCSLPTTLAVYRTQHHTQYCCCWLLCAATLCSSHYALTDCVSTHHAIHTRTQFTTLTVPLPTALHSDTQTPSDRYHHPNSNSLQRFRSSRVLFFLSATARCSAPSFPM